jgi:ureidoglycolate hydrolase
MSGYASYSSDEFLNSKYTIKHLKLQDQSELPPSYGKLVHRIDSKDVEVVNFDVIIEGTKQTIIVPKDVVSGDFVVWNNQDLVQGENHAVQSGLYTIARYKDARHLYIREYNYHPESSQMIYPMQQEPFISLLGRGDTIGAYKFDGSSGLCIHPGTWHQPPIPLTEKQVFSNIQSMAHLCVCKDVLTDDNTWISIDL